MISGQGVQHPVRGGALVLGIGNLLWADEGFGIRAVEALHAAYAAPEEVELIDGGAQGLNLLEPLLRRAAVLVFDAIDFGLAPGSLRVLRDAEVPKWIGRKLSPHQIGFHELPAVAELQGRAPPKLTLVGVQPERLADFGGSLSDCVRDRIDVAVELAVEELARWGHALAVRRAPAAPLHAEALALAAYEAGRPSEQAACRIGDARFLDLLAAGR